jgi:ribosomal protein S18 acetylase RimI-like enzyme
VPRRVPADPQLLRATSADTSTLVEALVRAFVDDPVASFMFCDESRRPDALRKFFSIQLSRDYLQNGEVWTDEKRSGAAIWGPPTKPRPGMRDLFRVFPLVRELMPLSHMREALKGLFAVESERPKVPHWYLATLGTDPVAQHHGVGSALLNKTLGRIDEEGMPTYLECSKERNVSFYSRFGFKVTKEMRAVDSGPLIWLMWRDPRPPELE